MDLDFLRDYFSITLFPPFQKPMVGAGPYLQPAREVLQRAAEKIMNFSFAEGSTVQKFNVWQRVDRGLNAATVMANPGHVGTEL